jgi:hypothetical protein
VNELSNHPTEGKSRISNHLAIPVYTKERLKIYSINDLRLIQERHEAVGLFETVTMCREVIEEKQINEPTIKQRRKKIASNKEKDKSQPKSPRIRPKHSKAISWHFEDLGSPLNNIVWSWGSISKTKRDIFLRVWEDQIEHRDGEIIVRLTNHSKFKGSSNCGYRERNRHLDLIKNNHRGHILKCTARDVMKSPRKIKSYDKERIYPILRIIQIQGDDWGVLGIGQEVSRYLIS